MKTIINLESGEVIERELNAEETAQQELDAQAYAEQEAAKAALEAKKQEIAAKLGITADEAKLLLA